MMAAHFEDSPAELFLCDPARAQHRAQQQQHRDEEGYAHPEVREEGAARLGLGGEGDVEEACYAVDEDCGSHLHLQGAGAGAGVRAGVGAGAGVG